MRLPAVLVAVVAASVALAGPAQAAQGDPFDDKQWGIDVIGGREAHEVATGAGITIAIVDTGVDLAHQDLAAKIVPGWDFVDDDDDPQDEEGHGTHVAGIAAAITDNGLGIAGVAGDARIMPIRVLDDEGSGSVSDVIAGVKWAVDNGADVVNLSLSRTAQAILGSGIEEAVRYAWEHGAIVVVAAGNDYVLSSGFSEENALVVSATTRNDTKPSYSSGVGAAKWGISAPGGGCGSATCAAEDGIISSWWNGTQPNVYAYLSGTSMAAPHVAGAAAVLRSQGLSQQATVDRLLATAVDVGSTGRDSTFGVGRLNLAAAVGVSNTATAEPTAAPTQAPQPQPAPTTQARPTPKPVEQPSPRDGEAAPTASSTPDAPAASDNPSAAASRPESGQASGIAANQPTGSDPDGQGQSAAAPAPSDQLLAAPPSDEEIEALAVIDPFRDSRLPPIAIAMVAITGFAWTIAVSRTRQDA